VKKYKIHSRSFAPFRQTINFSQRWKLIQCTENTV